MGKIRRPYQCKDPTTNFMFDLLIDIINNLDSDNITLPHASTTGQTANDHHNSLHASTHVKGGTDANSGSHEINISIPSGSRAYIKDSAGTNVASIDESGNLRIKGSVFETMSSV